MAIWPSSKSGLGAGIVQVLAPSQTTASRFKAADQHARFRRALNVPTKSLIDV